jgi:uncharacterized protein (UPF0262 family)
MDNEYISSLNLDGELLKYRANREIDTAIKDLLSYNYFSALCINAGPYDITLSISENKLIFNIKAPKKKSAKFVISLRSFRSIIKDYFLVCESYQEALSSGRADRVEAIDMGRRGLHNEGAELILDLCENSINTDFDTARRLFTIIATLHMK